MKKGLQKEWIFKKQKIKFYLSHKVFDVSSSGDSVTVQAKDSDGNELNFNGDYCLVSVGRKPYTDGLNLDSIGVNINNKGQIEVNDKLQTRKVSIQIRSD